MSDQEDAKLGIQSVEIAADIMRAISDGGGLMQLRDISSATGMHRGKVHRYIISLTRSGFLYQDAENGAYGIGPLAISLGLVGLRRLSPLRLVSRELSQFKNLVNETAVLAIWGEMGPTVIVLEESNHPITLNVSVGSILPIQHSAVGLTFKEFLAPEKVKRALTKEDGARFSRTDKKPEVHYGSDKKTSFLARSDGSLLPGINALAAPVFDHSENIVFVVGLVGRQESLNVDWQGNAARQLTQFVERVSGELGYI